MSTPERRNDDFLSALLDGAFRLDDPIRMAAAVDELCAGAPVASQELRERVVGLCRRELREAAAAPAPAPRRRRQVRRRPVLIAAGLACVLGAGVVGAVGISSPSEGTATLARMHPEASIAGGAAASTAATLDQVGQAQRDLRGQSAPTAAQRTASTPGTILPRDDQRLQHYTANLRLRVPTQKALSSATQRAMTTTRSLGGYVVDVDLTTPQAGQGAAVLDLRVPVGRIQAEVARLSRLGTITAQHVAISDLQGRFDAAGAKADALRESLALIDARLANPKLTSEAKVHLLAQRFRARRSLTALLQQQRVLAHQGAYASVALALQVGKGTPAAPLHHGHSSALGRAARSALGVVGAVGV